MHSEAVRDTEVYYMFNHLFTCVTHEPGARGITKKTPLCQQYVAIRMPALSQVPSKGIEPASSMLLLESMPCSGHRLACFKV